MNLYDDNRVRINRQLFEYMCHDPVLKEKTLSEAVNHIVRLYLKQKLRRLNNSKRQTP